MGSADFSRRALLRGGECFIVFAVSVRSPRVLTRSFPLIPAPFGLCCNLIHASQPIRTTFTGQCFAYGFLQTSPHNDALAFSCILPTAGRIRDFHPLERAPAGRTTKTNPGAPAPGFVSVLSYLDFLTRSLPHPASADSCRRRYRCRTRWPCQGWSPRRSRRGARCSRLPP